MKRRRFRYLLLAAGSIALMLVLSSCMTPKYSVSGYVTDANGNGISGVAVVFGDGLSSVTTDSNGYWSQSGLSGSVSVSVSMSGYSFYPSSQIVSGAQNGVDFTAYYSISGYVDGSEGNPIPGVTISFGDGLPSVTTDSNGRWSQTDLSGQTSVTPSLSGYSFSPPETTVEGPGDDLNFTGTALHPYTPSGPFPSDGQTGVSTNTALTWTGGGPGGDTAVYSVYLGTSSTPQLAQTGLTSASYNPGTLAYDTAYRWRIVSKDTVTGMTATGPVWTFTTRLRPTYSVSGYVTDSSGSGMSGVSLSFSGGLSSVTTDSNGHWTQSGLTGNVVVTPSLNDYTFSPTERTVTGADGGVDFTGARNITPPTAPSNPSPSDGMTEVSLTPTLSWSSSGNGVTYDIYFGTSSNPPLVESGVTSNSYALWTLAYSTEYYWKIVAKNPAGSAAGPVWTFTTQPRPTYSVSGYVTDSSGNGMSGVSLSFNDGLSSVTTDSNGHWTQSGLAGSVVVTPSLSGYTFSPTERAVTGADGGVDFTGYSDVTGNLSVTGEWFLGVKDDQGTLAGQIYSSPAFSTDGILFVGGAAGLFSVNNSTGNYIGGIKNSSGSYVNIWSSPVVDTSNDTVFVGTNDGHLIYTQYPFGSAYYLSVSQNPIIGAPLCFNGDVYVVDELGNIYELPESTLTPVKLSSVGDAVFSSPVTDGTDLFVGSTNGTFYAVNLTSGNTDWKYSAGQQILGTAAIDSNGNVYFAGTKLYSFTSAGQLRWSVNLDGSQVIGSPVVGSNGIVYTGTSFGDFYAVDASDGSIVWKDNLSTQIGGISNSALIGNNGVVYVSSGWILYALNAATGKTLSSVGLGYNVDSSPVLDDGYVYVGCDDGYLYRVQALSTGAASGGWPMFMHDRYHTGLGGE